MVKTLVEMQRWLLQEKRTQAWDTPLNSVNAIWAFMNNGNWLMQNGEHATLMLDNKPLQTTQPTAGLGYVKATQPVDFHSSEDHDFGYQQDKHWHKLGCCLCTVLPNVNRYL